MAPTTAVTAQSVGDLATLIDSFPGHLRDSGRLSYGHKRLGCRRLTRAESVQGDFPATKRGDRPSTEGERKCRRPGSGTPPRGDAPEGRGATPGQTPEARQLSQGVGAGPTWNQTIGSKEPCPEVRPPFHAGETSRVVWLGASRAALWTGTKVPSLRDFLALATGRHRPQAGLWRTLPMEVQK